MTFIPAENRDVRKNPGHLAYHVVRSVPYDSCTLVGHVLVLKYGDEVMMIACGDAGDDVEVAVCAPGEGGWRTAVANDTDKIAQMWSRAEVLQARVAGYAGGDPPPAGLLRAEALVVESLRHNPPEMPTVKKPEQLEPKFWPEVW